MFVLVNYATLLPCYKWQGVCVHINVCFHRNEVIRKKGTLQFVYNLIED